MSIVEGYFGSSGVLGGSYFGWVFEWIPVEVRVADPAHVAAISAPRTADIGPVIPRVIVRNTSSGLTADLSASLTDITINRDSTAAQDNYTVDLCDGETWNPDGEDKAGILLPGADDLDVEIYADYTVNGVAHSLRVFTGTISESSGELARADNKWHLAGANLAERFKSAYGSALGTGTRYNLLATVLRAAGVRAAYMAIPDAPIADPTSFITPTLKGIIDAFFRVSPGIDYYVDQNGHFVARRPRLDQAQTWEVDSSKNWVRWSPKKVAPQMANVVNVTGATADASQQVTTTAVDDPSITPVFGVPDPATVGVARSQAYGYTPGDYEYYLKGSDFVGGVVPAWYKQYPFSIPYLIGDGVPTNLALYPPGQHPITLYRRPRVSGVNSNVLTNTAEALTTAADLMQRSYRAAVSGDASLNRANFLFRAGDVLLLRDKKRKDGGLGSWLDGYAIRGRRSSWTWRRGSSSGVFTVGGDMI